MNNLRQVIGLRSYGQKDPLSEFRKEAFELFENLLIKIKTETVKFLFNVNIVVENEKKENKKNYYLRKRKKYQEILHVHVDQVKNINIAVEEQLK